MDSETPDPVDPALAAVELRLNVETFNAFLTAAAPLLSRPAEEADSWKGKGLDPHAAEALSQAVIDGCALVSRLCCLDRLEE